MSFDPWDLHAASFGRDFRLNSVPRDETGEVLYRGSTGEDYEAYVDWLADYLYAQRPVPSPRQRLLCEDLLSHRDKEWALQLLAMTAVLYDAYLLDAEIAIGEVLGGSLECDEAGVERILAHMAAERAEPDQEEPAVCASVVLDKDYSREDLRAILEELREEQERVPELEDYSWDLGWRTPLALLLADVPAKEERVRLLRRFFTFYGEYEAK